MKIISRRGDFGGVYDGPYLNRIPIWSFPIWFRSLRNRTTPFLKSVALGHWENVEKNVKKNFPCCAIICQERIACPTVMWWMKRFLQKNSVFLEIGKIEKMCFLYLFCRKLIYFCFVNSVKTCCIHFLYRKWNYL